MVKHEAETTDGYSRFFGHGSTIAAIIAAAGIAFPAPAFGQETRQAQQTQAEVPENWAQIAGICRRTIAS